MERDPREYPRPGDVVRCKSRKGRSRKIVAVGAPDTIWHTSDVLVEWESAPPPKHPPAFRNYMVLAGWRRWAKGGDVLERGPDGA